MSAVSRRIARLELAELQKLTPSSGSVTQHSFLKQVRARMRVKRESFEKAAQALVMDLRDDQLEALLAEAGEVEESDTDSFTISVGPLQDPH